MKTFTVTFLCVLSATLIAAGCDKHRDHPGEPITQAATAPAAVDKPAAADAPATPPVLVGPQNPPSDLVVGVMQQLKESTYETRAEIAAAFDPVNRQIEDRLAQWKSQGSQFTEPAERQLQDARANTVQKFKELGQATEETWNSAKDNASSALQHLQGAINDLLQSDDKLRKSAT